MKKTKIRIKILKTFSAVMFFSFLLTGIIFNVAIRFSFDNSYGLQFGTDYYDISVYADRAGLTLIVLIAAMFLAAVIAAYFISNSITRPIEKLSDFAQSIGSGNFTQNTFDFNVEELVDLNGALNKSIKKLGDYDSEQKDFFQNVSHELRTPLTSIRCYAEGMSVGIMEPKEASRTILEETDRLSSLVDDLLYIAKIDNITSVYKFETINIPKIIRECAERFQILADKNNVKIICKINDDKIEYYCVTKLIERAINNLISNAIRYASSEVTISCRVQHGFIKIKVSDNGAGIEPDAIPHVFDRLFKGSDGMHGIGLSIVKSVAEQHKGFVSAENKDGGGAVFDFNLPV